MGLGPFDLTGGPFLLLYLFVIVLASAISWMLTEALRPEGRPGKFLSEDELALLAGGNVRLAEAATTRLLAQGQLLQQGDSAFFAVAREGRGTAVEQGILGVATPATWPVVLNRVRLDSGQIQQRLVEAGLMVDEEQYRHLRRIAVAPLLAAAAFGGIKLFIGLERDRPVLILAVVLIVTVLLVVARRRSVSAATKSGAALVSAERNRCERLRRAPLTEEMGLSVALFGTAVLVGSEFAGFHAMRQKQDNGGGDGGGGGGCGSDGGGGGGGGGCGGCGGGD